MESIEIQVREQNCHSGEGGHFAVDSYDDESGVLLITIRHVIPGFDEAADD